VAVTVAVGSALDAAATEAVIGRQLAHLRAALRDRELMGGAL